MSPRSLSVVVPVLNEEGMIDATVAALKPVLDELDLDWTVLFIDDGSTDATLDRIRAAAAAEPRVRAVSFSRNFGKEQAIAAGLRHARGDGVIVMDGDLQHPPSAIPQFVEHWRQGARIVFGRRNDWQSGSLFRRWASDAYHGLFAVLVGERLPRGVTDFVLLDRSAVRAMNRLDERARFTKGLFTWIGFEAEVVPFDAPARTVGETKYNLRKLVRFAFDGIFSFSTLPLRVWTYVGAAISLGALLYALYFLIKTLIFKADVPGFPSIIVSIMFFAGVQLLSLGVIGEYIGRIFDEVKRRPLYIVEETIGEPDDADRAADG